MTQHISVTASWAGEDGTEKDKIKLAGGGSLETPGGVVENVLFQTLGESLNLRFKLEDSPKTRFAVPSSDLIEWVGGAPTGKLKIIRKSDSLVEVLVPPRQDGDHVQQFAFRLGVQHFNEKDKVWKSVRYTSNQALLYQGFELTLDLEARVEPGDDGKYSISALDLVQVPQGASLVLNLTLDDQGCDCKARFPDLASDAFVWTLTLAPKSAVYQRKCDTQVTLRETNINSRLSPRVYSFYLVAEAEFDGVAQVIKSPDPTLINKGSQDGDGAGKRNRQPNRC